MVSSHEIVAAESSGPSLLAGGAGLVYKPRLREDAGGQEEMAKDENTLHN